MQSYRQCLVMGCGAECKNHPSERWFSIDSSNEKKPDLCKRPSEVTPRDFGKNIDHSKFKIIFLENLSAAYRPGVDQLKTLLADTGSVIAYGWQVPWKDCLAAKLDIDYFISDKNNTILIMHGASLAKTLELLRTELSNRECDKPFLQYMNHIESKINKLSADADNQLPPLLVSVLAHLHTYVALRNDRLVKTYYKNHKYETLLNAMKALMLSFTHGQKSLEDARDTIDKWKHRLPSSLWPTEKLNYTPLKIILDMAYEAMSYYVTIKKLAGPNVMPYSIP